jgi:hypothetical protein
MTECGYRGEVARGAVAVDGGHVARVTVSRNDAVILVSACSKREMHVTYMCQSSRRIRKVLRLIVLNCGGCLLDALSQPITVGGFIHGLLHRHLEVSIGHAC